MKRSEVINLIFDYLQKWEDCKLNNNCAEGLLTLLEDEGMTPPSYFEGKGNYGLILKQGWEK